MAQMRLQKYLSQCGIASRRASEELIKEGKVRVNGRIVIEMGTKIDPDKDKVQVGRRFIRAEEKGILIFYKPKGVVSTLHDPEGRPSIADYLTKHYQSYFPVGRLDFDSTGLMILTNDGDLAERLMHPRFELDRVYHVKVMGVVEPRTLAKIQRGIMLEDGIAKAEASILNTEKDSTWLEMRVKEGRNRLIRRMLEKIYHPVSKLQRVQHGPFRIGNMRPGAMKKLTQREYEQHRDRLMELEDKRGKKSTTPSEE